VTSSIFSFSPAQSSLAGTQCGAEKSSAVTEASLPRFGIGPLLDLVEARIGAANPIVCFVYLLWIYWNRAWNLLPSGHQGAFVLRRFRAFDRKFRVMPNLSSA
jgi:hypothetical protein